MLCAVDLAAMPPGSALRTSVAGVVTEVLHEDGSLLLCFDASFGHYVTGAILDAGVEFGIEVDGVTAHPR
jgi:sarcosine oxidase gamma subunit